MIRTIMYISWLNLKRDRVSFGMRFVLPIVFFSIFAMIFGATTTGVKDTKIAVAVVDLDQTETSRRFVTALGKQGALETSTAPGLDSARALVRDGKAPIAVVVERGFGAAFGGFANTETVEMIYDSANPFAARAVSGLLQAAAVTAAPDLLMQRGFSALQGFGAGVTPKQASAIDSVRPYLRGDRPWPGGQGATTTAGSNGSLLNVRETDVRAGEAKGQDKHYSMTSYYAAGIGVMFLLFSMSAGGGVLLDEKESGTLERLLSTNASMTHVLVGKWLFLAVNGVAQLCLMFLWAVVAFHLRLFTPARLSGFAAMTIVTAAAAAGFGLVLASACKTREQLGGISTILILIMSALGGSMVPRFIMPKFMETTELFTFNGWALDGFLKVFWYDQPNATVLQTLADLVPQLAVLAVAACLFLGASRLLARRWETT